MKYILGKLYCWQSCWHDLTYSEHLCAITVCGVPQPVHNVDPYQHRRARLTQGWHAVVPEISTLPPIMIRIVNKSIYEFINSIFTNIIVYHCHRRHQLLNAGESRSLKVWLALLDHLHFPEIFVFSHFKKITFVQKSNWYKECFCVIAF